MARPQENAAVVLNVERDPADYNCDQFARHARANPPSGSGHLRTFFHYARLKVERVEARFVFLRSYRSRQFVCARSRSDCCLRTQRNERDRYISARYPRTRPSVGRPTRTSQHADLAARDRGCPGRRRAAGFRRDGNVSTSGRNHVAAEYDVHTHHLNGNGESAGRDRAQRSRASYARCNECANHGARQKLFLVFEPDEFAGQLLRVSGLLVYTAFVLYVNRGRLLRRVL